MSDLRLFPIEPADARVDSLLEGWRGELADDFDAYRGHVHRDLCFAASLAGVSREDDAFTTLAIAAAFHDVGIWLDHTFDYLESSAERARSHLESEGELARWPQVQSMILLHHRVRAVDDPLVDAFRRADWLDLCLCLPPTRLPNDYVRNVVRAFPRAGFHVGLLQKEARWFVRHPLNPLPMFRW